MKRPFIAVFAFLILPVLPGKAEEASLGGSITLPALESKTKRTFRGSVYRSRLESSSKVSAKKKQAVSPFKDVVVSAHPLSFRVEVQPLPEPARVEQFDVAFTPHVLPITAGTTVHFVNKDKIYHNVFSLTRGVTFDIGRKPTGVVEPQKIDKVGEIELFCDIHPQMNATILSLDTPYFTQPDARGHYAVADLPAGTYEIRVYHPDLPLFEEQIELQAGQQLVKDFILNR
jgi:plastocyanin